MTLQIHVKCRFWRSGCPASGGKWWEAYGSWSMRAGEVELPGVHMGLSTWCGALSWVHNGLSTWCVLSGWGDG